MGLILKEFKPFVKFLSVKILVSIVFFQQFLMQAIMGKLGPFQFSTPQIRLLYPCVICFEVFVLSLVVWWAWRPRPGDWYTGDLNTWDQQSVDLAGHASNLYASQASFVRGRVLQTLRGSRPNSVCLVLRGHNGKVQRADWESIITMVNQLTQDRIQASFLPSGLQ